jgi:EAL domain-containing protein (putative c-di-GMP-specific phosphodiesterase class I)
MSDDSMTHISQPLSDVLKEIVRRAELRPRFEAEWGRPLTDQEFIAIADATGLKL